MKSRYFAFLRRLQAKGRTNMYGAVPYLMSTFGLDRDHAFRVVCEWLDRQAADPEIPISRPNRLTERTARPAKKRLKLSGAAR